jgi:hypothetical protein
MTRPGRALDNGRRGPNEPSAGKGECFRSEHDKRPFSFLSKYSRVFITLTINSKFQNYDEAKNFPEHRGAREEVSGKKFASRRIFWFRKNFGEARVLKFINLHD